MSEDGSDTAPARDLPDPEARRRLHAEAERRRRRAEVFGDVLPVTTSDERDPAPGAGEGEAVDRWWREQVPPHHG